MIIDAHIHCHLTRNNKEQQIAIMKADMQNNNINKALLYLIDDDDFKENNFKLNFGENIIVSVAIDPRKAAIESDICDLKESGVRLLKLLPYEQQILYKDFDMVCDFAKTAEKYGMMLCICGSYGSKDVYNTNGVELAAKILKNGFNRPLIIAHGGMVRQLDTASLMREYDNLFIDTSFTIKYWWGSHVIEDFRFVMEMFDYDRIFYGSDYPYHSFEESMKYFNMFCDKYQVTQENKNKLLYKNFEKFADKYLRE